jgi:hypothetical protein
MQPVKKQLKRYVQVCANNDEYQRRLTDIGRVVKSPEWKYVIQILWTIKNEMAIELMSSKFTALTPDEKDRTQAVYANINEWIDFLTSPMNWVGKKGLIQLFTSKFKGEVQTQGEAKPERRKNV